MPWKGREEFYDPEGNKTAEFVMEAGVEHVLMHQGIIFQL